MRTHTHTHTHKLILGLLCCAIAQASAIVTVAGEVNCTQNDQPSVHLTLDAPGSIQCGPFGSATSYTEVDVTSSDFRVQAVIGAWQSLGQGGSTAKLSVIWETELTVFGGTGQGELDNFLQRSPISGLGCNLMVDGVPIFNCGAFTFTFGVPFKIQAIIAGDALNFAEAGQIILDFERFRQFPVAVTAVAFDAAGAENVAATPEPHTLVLMAAGLAIGFARSCARR